MAFSLPLTIYGQYFSLLSRRIYFLLSGLCCSGFLFWRLPLCFIGFLNQQGILCCRIYYGWPLRDIWIYPFIYWIRQYNQGRMRFCINARPVRFAKRLLKYIYYVFESFCSLSICRIYRKKWSPRYTEYSFLNVGLLRLKILMKCLWTAIDLCSSLCYNRNSRFGYLYIFSLYLLIFKGVQFDKMEGDFIKLPVNFQPLITSFEPEAFVFGFLTAIDNSQLPFLLSRYISIFACDAQDGGAVMSFNNN